MDIHTFIRENRQSIIDIAAKNGATNVRLFGSVARGKGTEDSDIDLLVTMEPGSTLLDIIAIKQDVEDFVGRKVDVVTENSLSPYIRNEVLKDAVNL